MNNFKLIVFKNISLFNIISELNNIFPYKLNLHKEDKNIVLNILEKEPDTIVLSTERISDKINNLVIEKPIKINNLIEKINISFLKLNYKFLSSFNLGEYYLDINSRFLSKKELKLKLTQKEVEIICYLKNSNPEASTQTLQKEIWKHSTSLETHTVETHIYRLRKKIAEKFKDKNFILNNKKGYRLFN